MNFSAHGYQQRTLKSVQFLITYVEHVPQSMFRKNALHSLGSKFQAGVVSTSRWHFTFELSLMNATSADPNLGRGMCFQMNLMKFDVLKEYSWSYHMSVFQHRTEWNKKTKHSFRSTSQSNMFVRTIMKWPIPYLRRWRVGLNLVMTHALHQLFCFGKKTCVRAKEVRSAFDMGTHKCKYTVGCAPSKVVNQPWLWIARIIEKLTGNLRESMLHSCYQSDQARCETNWTHDNRNQIVDCIKAPLEWYIMNQNSSKTTHRILSKQIVHHTEVSVHHRSVEKSPNACAKLCTSVGRPSSSH